MRVVVPPRDPVGYGTPMGVLFLSGNQRSGKTLLQLMLCSHPEITISPGTNVIAKMLYRFPRDRPLDEKGIRELKRTLQKDRKWKAWRVDHRAYLDRVAEYRNVTPRDVVHDLMGFFRDQTKPGARYIGNKKGCYSKEGDVVKRVFPEAKLVFIVRDARGAVSSMLETQPEHDIYSASLTWRLKARRIREIQAGFPGDVSVVRYESLVTDPEGTCRDLCRFLGLDYAPAMLQDYRSNDATRHATDTTHAETYQGITTSMIDEWKQRLSGDQVEVIEGIAGHELVQHGYPLASEGPRRLRDRARLRLMVARDHSTWWLHHRRSLAVVG